MESNVIWRASARWCRHGSSRGVVVQYMGSTYTSLARAARALRARPSASRSPVSTATTCTSSCVHRHGGCWRRQHLQGSKAGGRQTSCHKCFDARRLLWPRALWLPTAALFASRSSSSPHVWYSAICQESPQPAAVPLALLQIRPPRHVYRCSRPGLQRLRPWLRGAPGDWGGSSLPGY